VCQEDQIRRIGLGGSDMGVAEGLEIKLTKINKSCQEKMQN
jgi:hypothetical protein